MELQYRASSARPCRLFKGGVLGLIFYAEERMTQTKAPPFRHRRTGHPKFQGKGWATRRRHAALSRRKCSVDLLLGKVADNKLEDLSTQATQYNTDDHKDEIVFLPFPERGQFRRISIVKEILDAFFVS